MSVFTVRGWVQQRRSLLATLLVIAAVIFLSPAAAVQAQSGVELSTTYPGIGAAGGETVSFPLKISNHDPAGQTVKLVVSSLPEGWSTSINGNGRVIQEVYVQGNAVESPDLKVEIPGDVKAGTYSVIAQAVGERGEDSLTLWIRVAAGQAGADELVAQYSELKGPADAIFTFKLDLTNKGAGDQIFSLGAATPPGWQISFQPSYEKQQVASISVKGGETKGLDVTVTPAANVEAGEFKIPVQAVSSTGKAVAELKIIISGTYNLELTTPSGRLNADAIAGKETKVNLEVKNNGSADLNNISFASSEPQNWSVTFDPQTVDTLAPGASRQVTASIVADGKAIAGDYLITLSAATRETKDQADLRVTVKTSTLWGIVALMIVLLVIAGVYWTFRRYGRR